MANTSPLSHRLHSCWTDMHMAAERIMLKHPLLTLLGIFAIALATMFSTATGRAMAMGEPLTCESPYIVDGDTLRCMDQRIRLIGIDAPEMPGHCRTGRTCAPGDAVASREHLVAITRTTVKCFPEGLDPYGRTLARCGVAGADLSCSMIAAGHAIPRYRDISCPVR